MLRDCDTPYITKYMNCYRQGVDKLYVLMELCEIGSVMGMLPKLGLQGFPEPTIAYIMYGVLNGLLYLHKNHKMHRDIKGGNVLVSTTGQIKLADFGITAMLDNTWGRRNTFIGSPYWFVSITSLSALFSRMAPEIATEESYDIEVDVWSTGITCIELAEGKPPYSDLKWQQAIKEITSKDPPHLANPSQWSPEFNDFIAQCLIKEPIRRFDISLFSPFFVSLFFL